MASTTSVTGLASGIDSKSIIEAFAQADRAPARIIESRRSQFQARLDAVRGYNTKLLALRDAADALKGSDIWAARVATSGKPEALAISVGASANATSMTVSVKELATAQQLRSLVGRSDATTSVAADGDLSIQVGSGAVKNITLTDRSLNGIATAINAANAGVQASVVNTGADGYRLLVQSKTTGQANAITSLSASGSLSAALFAGEDLGSAAGIAAGSQITAAKDAAIRIGDPDTGQLITRASNVITDAIDGVTFTLKAKVDSISVDIANDDGKVATKVKTFVEAYNAAFDYLKANASYDAANKKAGPLLAESDLRMAISNLQNDMLGQQSGQATGYTSLQDMGVNLGQDGRMTFTEATLTSKLGSDRSAVKTLFQARAGATFNRLFTLTDTTIGIPSKAAGIESSITDMTAQIAKIDARVEVRRARYTAQFTAMETTIQRLNSQGSYFSSQVAGWNKSTN